MTPDAIFFESPAGFRRWLEANHEQARELWVGFHRKGTGRPSMTWPESVAEALCVGWIDGVRRRIDDERYAIRFTPRKPTSIWSAVNVALMERLIGEGRVHEAGRRAFAARSPERTAVYSYERGAVTLDADAARVLQANAAAWRWFEAAPAWYRKAAISRIMSAKRAETRQRRLAELVEHSAAGRTIPSLTRAKA
jgi:uncharacterized protein YdeI (YjbR/CyaY-like superfamily)